MSKMEDSSTYSEKLRCKEKHLGAIKMTKCALI